MSDAPRSEPTTVAGASAAPSSAGAVPVPAAASAERRAAQHAQCESLLAKLAGADYHITWLLAALKNSGCATVAPDGRAFFRCAPCGDVPALAYFQAGEGVVVCEDRLEPGQNTTAGSFRANLRHELVHAFDTCRADLDARNCLHIACTEIRASALSGECHYKYELMRGNLAFPNHFEDCVKRRATLSLQMHPHCSSKASAAVEAAWSRCFNDTAPFDEHP